MIIRSGAFPSSLVALSFRRLRIHMAHMAAQTSRIGVAMLLKLAA
jgi:hypothetical protein